MVKSEKKNYWFFLLYLIVGHLTIYIFFLKVDFSLIFEVNKIWKCYQWNLFEVWSVLKKQAIKISQILIFSVSLCLLFHECNLTYLHCQFSSCVPFTLCPTTWISLFPISNQCVFVQLYVLWLFSLTITFIPRFLEFP